jgi:hypothetical protein
MTTIVTAARTLVVVLSLAACGRKDADPQSPRAQVDAAPRRSPNRPTPSAIPAGRVVHLRRVKLGAPARFPQRVDPNETDPRRLAAADAGAVETTDVLVVQLELDRPVSPGRRTRPDHLLQPRPAAAARLARPHHHRRRSRSRE